MDCEMLHPWCQALASFILQPSISLYACQQAPTHRLMSWVPVQAAIDAVGAHEQWICKECSPARCGASPASITRNDHLFHPPTSAAPVSLR